MTLLFFVLIIQILTITILKIFIEENEEKLIIIFSH